MKTVFLTFDDGPHPVHTPEVLEVLRRHGAHATFFQIGEEVARYPELTRRVVAEGHAVGNHSWSHRDLSSLGRDEGSVELETANVVLADVLGQPPVLFRPPFGRLGPTTRSDAAAAGLETVVWDVDPLDWGCPGEDAIVSRVLAGVEDRTIVLLHDGGGDRSQTVAAVDRILGVLRERGIAFPVLTAGGEIIQLRS